MSYEKIPILDTARRCGLVLDSRTINRSEVEASCPFCGDHGFGKFHLSLNTAKDLYRCNLCNASGNSVTMYAKIYNLSNFDAYKELMSDCKIYKFPQQPLPKIQEREPSELFIRHEVYSEMLSLLTLENKHLDNLAERGLSVEQIRKNEYKSMPTTQSARKLLAWLLSTKHDLCGIPGFYTQNDTWTLAGANGFLIPVRDKNGLIQGLKIRLDDDSKPNRKYRWFSSRDVKFENGTRSYSWIHVTGDTSRKRAFLTEGPLKGDVASHLSKGELFVCVGGINSIKGLRETIISLGVLEVVEAMDMDQYTNPQVRKGVLALRKEVQSISGIKYSKYTWSSAFKGIDDYFLSQIASM